MRIGELVTVGEGETPIENFQYSPWMPFGNLLEKKRIIFVNRDEVVHRAALPNL